MWPCSSLFWFCLYIFLGERIKLSYILSNLPTFVTLTISILGMNLFGCKFCYKLQDGSTYCDRKNFDSLLWALVTVFQVKTWSETLEIILLNDFNLQQILTQEDWNVVLFNGMERTTHWAALYFVLLMTFGNYVLFNLLVAILVEGFSQEVLILINSWTEFFHFFFLLVERSWFRQFRRRWRYW